MVGELRRVSRCLERGGGGFHRVRILCQSSLDSHEGLSTKIELTCATSIRRQDAGSCWRARESAGTLCRNLQRAGEDYGRVFETVQSLPSRSDRWWRSRRRNPGRCGLTLLSHSPDQYWLPAVCRDCSPSWST